MSFPQETQSSRYQARNYEHESRGGWHNDRLRACVSTLEAEDASTLIVCSSVPSTYDGSVWWVLVRASVSPFNAFKTLGPSPRKFCSMTSEARNRTPEILALHVEIKIKIYPRNETHNRFNTFVKYSEHFSLVQTVNR